MKKTFILLFASLTFASAPWADTYAQVETDEDNTEEAIDLDEDTDEDDEETDAVNARIDIPAGMEAEMDSLLNEWNNKTYLIPEGDCNDTGVNPDFDRETYIHRLQRLPNVIEMPYNDVVRHFIDQYTGRLRRSVSIILGASNFYTPIFEEALEAYQLPLELKYLPVIESALNPQAVSRAGAVGLWQFMITTAKQYGLEVTSLIDERRDPIKSSYAAAHYLKDLYDIFGDWTLAIASYNCGPGNVRKAISRAGGSKDYWQIYPYLPQETRGYVPAFIAANYIMTYYCEHNICPASAQLPAATDTVMVARNLHADQIVALCNISAEALRALNPQYRTALIPGLSHPCALRLPNASMTAFIEAGDSIYAYRATELLTSRAEIEIAQAQQAPANPKVSPRRGRSRSRNTGRGTRSATVRRGDTLGAIAKRNGTTVAKLRQLNGIRGNNIKAGQKIRVK
ncbi:MAG: transglycosylase SLT domain-containing protein [Bacteroidaceae bacterium]|nr:transglycosylase SLT domain-containing protein [Bacteroidaceae bacterium]